MATPQLEPLQTRLETVIALSRLLERVEARGVAIGADQYRALVRQLQAALATPLPEQAVAVILAAHPAAAELYENLHYDVSGLSRSPRSAAIVSATSFLKRTTAASIANSSIGASGSASIARLCAVIIALSSSNATSSDL